MMDLAIAFAWAFGLRDHVAAAALGISEAEYRRRRLALDLHKRSGGRPVLFQGETGWPI